MPLEPDDLRHVTAAPGYVELGLPLDADGESHCVDADVRHLPEVLTVRIQIYSALKKWELMQAIAKRMALYNPEDRSGRSRGDPRAMHARMRRTLQGRPRLEERLRVSAPGLKLRRLRCPYEFGKAHLAGEARTSPSIQR